MYERKDKLVRQARDLLAKAGYKISARRINRAFTFSNKSSDQSGSHALWGALQNANPTILARKLEARGVVFRGKVAVGRRHDSNNPTRAWRGGKRGTKGVKLSPPKKEPTVPTVEMSVEIEDGNICPNPNCGYHDPSPEATRCPSCGTLY